MASKSTPPPGSPPVTPMININLPAEEGSGDETLAKEKGRRDQEEEEHPVQPSHPPSSPLPPPIESGFVVPLEIAPESETASTAAKEPPPDEPRIKLLHWLLVGGTGRPPTRATFWRMVKQRNDAGRHAKHKAKRNKEEIGSHSNATDERLDNT